MVQGPPVVGRWIGLDISSTTSGWAVVDSPSTGPVLVASGIIRMSRKPKDSIGLRLERLFEGLVEIMRTHRPAHVLLEGGFCRHGTATRRTSEARGVALLVLHGARLVVETVPPRAVKLKIGGHGGADKDRMEKAVRMICRGCPATFASDDESDAVACALYGALILGPTVCPI